jgi:uncharacterized membrane protein (UPF0127 family)
LLKKITTTKRKTLAWENNKMLINTKTKKVLAKEVVHLRSFHKIGFGLMFKSRKSCENKAFIFHLNPKIKYSITMWFVFFKLDVIMLDKDKKVVEIKKNLNSFAIYHPKHKFKYMIEMLPATLDVNIGDVLDID